MKRPGQLLSLSRCVRASVDNSAVSQLADRLADRVAHHQLSPKRTVEPRRRCNPTGTGHRLQYRNTRPPRRRRPLATRSFASKPARDVSHHEQTIESTDPGVHLGRGAAHVPQFGAAHGERGGRRSTHWSGKRVRRTDFSGGKCVSTCLIILFIVFPPSVENNARKRHHRRFRVGAIDTASRRNKKR